MNVLVLHNNNLPSFLLLDDLWGEGISITSRSVTLPPTDVPIFDSFISNLLNDNDVNLENNKFDVIILPFNTTDNELEYTGLRIAAHLRLTASWHCLSTPILFLGPNTDREVYQFSELGCILNTYNVFTSPKNSFEEIKAILKWIKDHKKNVDEDSFEYKDFLRRMKCLSPPANYATHHSLANEWAIMRWNDMMTNPIHLDNKDFTSMLYYKYLRAKHGNVKQLKKWKKDNPDIEKIPNIEDIDRIGPKEEIESKKKLVLIDDEWEKGWSQLLNHIADSSGFSFECCPIKKEWDRVTLIKEIESFIDKIENKDNGADCYLLDLRLHDTDFDEEYLKVNKLRLSGFDVLDYIKEKNEANPVVIFSASNKMWNFKDTVFNYKSPTSLEKEGAFDYVLKETPESVLKPDESYKLYTDFVSSIRTSFKLSELKKIVDKQSDLKKLCPDVDTLDDFVKLVLLDKGNPNNNSILKACLMNLMTFLEDYIKGKYSLQKTGKNTSAEIIQLQETKQGGKTILNGVNKHVFVQRQEIVGTPYVNIIDSYYTIEPSQPEDHFAEVNCGDIGLILSALYIQYNFNTKVINDIFLPIKNKRNSISHKSNNVSLNYKELYDFYFKIIVPVIEHDH